ncbi:MAG: hypothetical protein ACJ797_20360 [Ktedonobacteraceae bacterium]
MEHFKRFKMPNLLTKNSVLILNTEQGILTLLSERSILQQQLLSPSETSLIAKLLEMYPEYCPNEVLFSVHTGEDVEKSRQQLLNASKEQTMHEMTKSLRAVLARCRKKLHPFGIEIVTLLGRGCSLEPLNHKAKTDMTSRGMLDNKSEMLT